MLETTLLAPLITTLLVMTALKYKLDEWYDMNSHKFPPIYPESFCLLCFATQLGFIVTAITTLSLNLTITQFIVSWLLCPIIAIITTK